MVNRWKYVYDGVIVNHLVKESVSDFNKRRGWFWQNHVVNDETYIPSPRSYGNLYRETCSKARQKISEETFNMHLKELVKKGDLIKYPKKLGYGVSPQTLGLYLRFLCDATRRFGKTDMLRKTLRFPFFFTATFQIEVKVKNLIARDGTMVQSVTDTIVTRIPSYHFQIPNYYFHYFHLFPGFKIEVPYSCPAFL